MAFLVKASGEIEEVNDFSLENLQRLVGGYIQIVWSYRDLRLIINEEGKLKNLPINLFASLLYPETLLGDVVVVLERELKEQEEQDKNEEL